MDSSSSCDKDNVVPGKKAVIVQPRDLAQPAPYPVSNYSLAKLLGYGEPKAVPVEPVASAVNNE